MGDFGENSTFFSAEDSATTSRPDYTNNLDDIFSVNRLSYVAELVEHYYTPLLCCVGAIGNCLSLAVFCFNANQRNLSSSYYLSALAISDTGFLITVFVFWLETFGPGVLSSKLGCPFIMYSGQVTCFLSVWLTVSFTIERYFAVMHPLRCSSVCTVSKAKKVIFSLTTFAIIAFSYALLIARVEDTANIRNDDYLLHQQNHDDNHTTPTSVIEQSFTPQRESLIPLHLNHQESSNDFLHSLKMNRAGCFEEESCQRQFANSVRGDGGETFSNLDESDGQVGRGGMTGFPSNGDDNDGDSILGNPLMTMFNSTTMLINLNKGDSSTGYEGAEKGGESHQPELRCTVPLKYITVSIIANYLDSVITLIIPFCLITYFNVRIAVCVWRLKDERKRIVAGTVMSRRKLNQISTPSSQTSTGAKSYLGRMVRRGRPPQDAEEAAQELRPINHIHHQRDGWTCQMCGRVPGGDSSNLNLMEQFPEQRTNANHVNVGHLSQQQNEISCPGCKSLQSQPTLNESGSLVSLPASLENRTTALRERNLPSNCAHNCSSSTTNPVLLPTELSPALDLNRRVGQSVQNSQLRSFKNLIPNTLHGMGIISRRGNLTVCNTPQSTISSSSETRVTKMLLLVSTSFLILNLPSHAIRLLVFLQSVFWGDDIEVMRRLYAAQQLSNVLLFNTNFASNFILYCLSGRNFRKSLWNVLFGRCHKNKRRSPRSFANTTLKKTVRFVPSGNRADGNTVVEANEVIQQPAFPKNVTKTDITNEFESIELDTSIV